MFEGTFVFCFDSYMPVALLLTFLNHNTKANINDVDWVISVLFIREIITANKYSGQNRKNNPISVI